MVADCIRMKMVVRSKTSPVCCTLRSNVTLRFKEKGVRGISAVRRDVVEVFSVALCVSAKGGQEIREGNA